MKARHHHPGHRAEQHRTHNHTGRHTGQHPTPPHPRRRRGRPRKRTVGSLFVGLLLFMILLLTRNPEHNSVRYEMSTASEMPTTSETITSEMPAASETPTTSETITSEMPAASETPASSEMQAPSGTTTFPQSAASPLTIHFIDVGQGDATLIESDGHYMLIDAGNNDKGSAIQMYLMQQGVTTLDYVIGTHPDADHIGGLDVVIYKFDCQNIFLPNVANNTRTYEDVIQAIDEKSYSITHPEMGSTYTLGDATFTILAPNDDYGDDLNDWSIVLLLENGDHRFLFSGDAGLSAEADMLANSIDVSADVYKVGHHGSKTATGEDFLKAISPSYAVISVGEDNSYGHPDAEVLNQLRASGVQVFRTDEQGTITVTSDGTTLTWNCSPSESWQAGERGN